MKTIAGRIFPGPVSPPGQWGGPNADFPLLRAARAYVLDVTYNYPGRAVFLVGAIQSSQSTSIPEATGVRYSEPAFKFGSCRETIIRWCASPISRT